MHISMFKFLFLKAAIAELRKYQRKSYYMHIATHDTTTKHMQNNSYS